ncbi:hypothetical protein B0J13DRAFT_251682 [Dactylonectria estremocensis]|uniref:Uncharacterized protein n=1 Tax=Dactylonectria estremocensis TaxID=1079267 RepID=A0A9P9F482_9HYPO|nr:hypothetical protein B0J13DRAFT_251682 [Dactylonectria estremocensis]
MHMLQPPYNANFLNAGIMAAPAGVTKDGYEVQFGTNHVGHALLLKFLTPLLVDTTIKCSSASAVRLAVLSSSAHKYSLPGGIDLSTLKRSAEDISAVYRYGQSKLANGVYARELSERYPQFAKVSVSP